jgi:hypothetical protein
MQSKNQRKGGTNNEWFKGKAGAQTCNHQSGLSFIKKKPAKLHEA